MFCPAATLLSLQGSIRFRRLAYEKKKSSVERNLFHQPDQKQQPMSSDFRKKSWFDTTPTVCVEAPAMPRQ